MYKVIKKQSPNFSKSFYSKIGCQIHKTLGTSSLGWLTDPKSQASAHLLISRDGTVYELVDGKDRAWSSGRINQPSKRAKDIMLKTLWGSYVKPGHYLWQIEFECLANETFTDEQYNSFIRYAKENNLPVIPMLFLTHEDTAIDKPNLEKERNEILKRYQKQDVPLVDDKEKIKEQIINLIKQL